MDMNDFSQIFFTEAEELLAEMEQELYSSMLLLPTVSN